MKSLIRNQRGAIVIEAAFVLPLLLFIVFSAFELSRALMIRVSLDHVISEATRQIKLAPASGVNFKAQLVAEIKKQSLGMLKSSLIEVESVKVYKSISDLLAKVESPDASAALAFSSAAFSRSH